MTAFNGQFGLRHCPMSKRRSMLAFTLVELLIVLIIIGVMTGGIAVMFTSNRSQIKVRVAAQDLGSAIAFAREESMVFGASFRVVFSDDLSRYRVERLSMGWANAGTRDDAYQPVPGAAGRWHLMDAGVKISVQVGGGRQKQFSHDLLFSGVNEGFSGQIDLEYGAMRWRIEVSDGGSVSVAEFQES
jgi:prepilin-type N-terminal cleavage/methylation domain-containing protein